MPFYEFECTDENCNHVFDEMMGMSEYNIIPHGGICPKCKKKKVVRKYSECHIVDNFTPRTIGKQAEINAKRMGKEQMQIMEEKHRKLKKYTGDLPKGGKAKSHE